MNVGWIDRDPGVSVYQSRGYGEAAVLSAGSRWDVIGSDDGRWRVPVVISPIGDFEGVDAASPYGYAGIHADASLTPVEVSEAWSATLALLADRGVVSAFLRFAPYRAGIERAHELPGLQLIEMSETIRVPLGAAADMWEGMQGRSRTAVRKAQRSGYQARVGDLSAVGEPGRGFRRVYEEAMQRVDASAIHFHPAEYYRRLTDAEDVDMHLIEVIDEEEQVVAATLLLVDQEAVHYHLSGSLLDGARNGANNLMIWTAMNWAAERGHSHLHLGGGTSRGDGLYRFKASFGGDSLPFRSGRVIVRERQYDDLVARQARSLGVDEAVLRASTFFPAYRAVVR